MTTDMMFLCSIWFDSCLAVFHHPGLHSQAGENPELRTFFFKLCHFAKLPATLVFVTNGPQQPPKKHGHRVITHPLWYMKKVKELIEAFGFYSHDVHIYICW
jgi:hypothetical protein